MKNTAKYYLKKTLFSNFVFLLFAIFGLFGLMIQNSLLQFLYGLLFVAATIGVFFVFGKTGGTEAVNAKFRLRKSNPNVSDFEYNAKAFSILNAFLTPVIISAVPVIIFLVGLIFDLRILKIIVSVWQSGFTSILGAFSYPLLDGWFFAIYLALFITGIAAYAFGYYISGLKQKRMFDEANAEIREFGTF